MSSADGQVDEPALLGLVDDLEGDAGPTLDAIEEGIAVARLADSTGGDGPDLGHPVAVHHLTEAFERADRCVERLRADGFRGERVAAQQDALRRFFEQTWRCARGDLRDGHANGARPHIQDGNNLRRFRILGRRRSRWHGADRAGGLCPAMLPIILDIAPMQSPTE